MNATIEHDVLTLKTTTKTIHAMRVIDQSIIIIVGIINAAAAGTALALAFDSSL